MNQVEKFIAKHPTLYHMAEFKSWPTIREHGLLSVADLLNVYEVEEPRRSKLLSEWRQDSVPIRDGAPVIRDQHPMPPQSLKKVLCDGLSPQDWYRFLNSRCFFWVDENKLKRMLNARPYRDKKHDVLILDTRKLLERDLPRITVSHINTGYSGRNPAMRGMDVFHPIQYCCLAGRKKGIAELTVEGCVPDIEEVAVSVEVSKGDKTLGTVWQR